jgi:hypothetical protein
MSLFNARDKQLVEKNPYLKLPQEGADASANILDPLALQNILHAVIDDQKTAMEPGYRTRINDSRWRVQNLLGNVNAEIWTSMVKAAVKGMGATIHNAQPNGTWVPTDYESRIAQNAKTQESFLEVVVRFVDTNNAPELAYQDGKPVVNVTVQSPGLDEKTIAALTKKSEGDPEIKALLSVVTQLLINQQGNAPQAALPAKPLRATPVVEEEAALVEEAPKAKRTKTSPNIDREALAALSGLPTVE